MRYCLYSYQKICDILKNTGCGEEMFSRRIVYPHEKLDGDFYLWSKWDDIILYRKDRQLCIEKARWKEFPVYSSL